MRRINLLFWLLVAIIGFQSAKSQQNMQGFKMSGSDPETIEINQTFTAGAEISPFGEGLANVYGLAINANVFFENDNSIVRVILIDSNYEEHLVYEGHSLLESSLSSSLNEICEETSVMNSLRPLSLLIVVRDATFTLNSIEYVQKIPPGLSVALEARNKKQARNSEKIKQINRSLQAKGKHWVAGPTSVSEMSYSERKQLYGQSTFPPGFEYYSGGVFQVGNSMKSVPAASPYINEFDWRNRHGQNWISPVTNQGSCGSCWAFAATGATEALVNLYYNIPGLNLNLSEQDVLSCSGAGSCSGGYPSTALNYISQTGIVDEATFPYTASDQACENKGTNPNELIKIGGRLGFGYGDYPKTDDGLKKMIIEKGPISGGLYDWSHAMTLPGYKVVEEGDVFYYRDLNLARYWKTIGPGDPLIGKTVWIFKNSWGAGFGDNGYVYVETDIANIGWTSALLTPVQSLVVPRSVNCVDNDGDGFYWWGLGEKPASCPDCPDLADGDDNDPAKGPLDEYGYCMPIDSRPIANFIANDQSLNVGEYVTFTDLSSGGPTSWAWTFEGGTPGTSTEQNPVVQFNITGTFNVTLVVTNTNGSDEKLMVDYLNVTVTPPVADFTADETTIYIGESVKFHDNSQNCTTDRTWVFDSGTADLTDLLNPVVTYDSEGVYNVSLTVENPYGTTDTETKTGFVTVLDPANITYCSSNGDAGYEYISEVALGDFRNPSGSSGVVGYQDFTGSTSIIVAPGTSYTLTLTPGFAGRNKFEYWGVWIDYNQDGDFTDPGEQVYLTSKARSTVTGNISIPPGLNVETTMRVSISRNGVMPCGYIGLGEVEDYKIIIGLTDPQPPVADFTSDATVIDEGETAMFTDISSNSPESWYWEFGDGATSTARNPSHTYSAVGSYTVSLVAANAYGSSIKEKVGYITINEASPLDYCEPLNINSLPDYIDDFTFNGSPMQNSAGSGYLFVEDPIGPLTPGSSPVVTLDPYNDKNRNFWRIWIDFNRDGDFDDFDETLLANNNQKGGFISSIQIPAYATGQTKMRVTMRTGKSPASCDDNFDGQVIDYMIDFGSGKSGTIIPGNQIDARSFNVYPNPVSDILFIDFNEWKDAGRIRLIELTGKTLFEKRVDSNILRIDLSPYPKGIYFLEVSDDKTRKFKMISKQ